LIDRDGRTQEHLVCTSQLIGDAWPDFAAMLIEYIGAIEPDVVEYDFEYSVIDGPHACYCDRCIDAFVAHGGLGSSEGLDAAIIVRDHEEAWIDFMTTQSTALFVLMRQAVHDHPHPMQFGVYSGYQNRRTQRRYGVDWRKVGRAGATDLAGFGYGRPIDDIAATHDALPHTHTVFGAIVRPCRTHKQTAPHQISPAQLLRRAIDARDGVLIFDRLAMDGRTWFAISQLSRLAFAYESLLIDGERREVDGQRECDAAWLQSDTATLLCLMNETDAPRTFDIRLPTRLGPGTRFDTGDTVRGRWRITLDAGQFGVLVFESNERSTP
jgi:hypothetical protein